MDEFEIIKRYFVDPDIFESDHLVVGPGDDSAVLRVPDGSDLCVSTDTLIEGVHFPSGINAGVVASRSLGANLSDLAAMGADPYGCTLALTLADYSEEWLTEFSAKMRQVLHDYKLSLFGGNLARGQLSVTVNIMGLVPRDQSLLRSGAQLDDDIYVTGHLGDAAGGLAIIRDKMEVDHPTLLARYMNPAPRISIGRALRNIATSAIDISDGFSADLGHLCRSSGMGASVELDLIPVSESLVSAFGQESALNMAIQGGDDYELCFTAPERCAGSIRELMQTEGVTITCVGKIRAGSGVEITDSEGSLVPHTAGYKHF